jgi:hypothetical protein
VYSYGDEFNEACRSATDRIADCIDLDGDVWGLSNGVPEWVGPCVLRPNDIEQVCLFVGGSEFWFGDDPEGEGDAEAGICERRRAFPPNHTDATIAFRCCADAIR